MYIYILVCGLSSFIPSFTGTMEDFAQNIKVLQDHVEGVVTCAKDGRVCELLFSFLFWYTFLDEMNPTI